MEKLPEFKTKLSDELKKTKTARNNDLIRTLQEQIQQQKAILHKEYKNREKERHNTEVKLSISLWKKKNDIYGKIREEKKNHRINHEKEERKKLQQKKKAK